MAASHRTPGEGLPDRLLLESFRIETCRALRRLESRLATYRELADPLSVETAVTVSERLIARFRSEGALAEVEQLMQDAQRLGDALARAIVEWRGDADGEPASP